MSIFFVVSLFIKAAPGSNDLRKCYPRKRILGIIQELKIIGFYIHDFVCHSIFHLFNSIKQEFIFRTSYDTQNSEIFITFQLTKYMFNKLLLHILSACTTHYCYNKLFSVYFTPVFCEFLHVRGSLNFVAACINYPCSHDELLLFFPAWCNYAEYLHYALYNSCLYKFHLSSFMTHVLLSQTT